MRLTFRIALMASVFAIANAGAAGADPQATPDPNGVPGPPDSTIAVPTRDIVDVIRDLRHKPPTAEPRDYTHLMIAAAPVVAYNPASGLGIGAAGNVAFHKGPPETTRISSVVMSLTVTTKKQLLFNGKFDVSSAGNDWLFQSDNRI